MTDIRVWVDGTLVGADTPAVSAVDHGVTVGDGAFETAKIDHGVPFAVTRHLRRLDRTIAPSSCPSSRTSVVKRARPVTLSMASMRPPFSTIRAALSGASNSPAHAAAMAA